MKSLDGRTAIITGASSGIADSIVFAAKQEEPTTVSEIDLYRRDKLNDMI